MEKTRKVKHATFAIVLGAILVTLSVMMMTVTMVSASAEATLSSTEYGDNPLRTILMDEGKL